MISPQIGIDPALKALWPEARLACLTWRTLPAPENPALWSFFTQEILPGLNATLQDTPLAELPNLAHPKYKGKRIPAYDMIKFSVNLHRGCFGGCAFCIPVLPRPK